MGFKQIHLMWGAWVLLLELLNVLKISFNGIFGETSIYSMEKSKYLGQYQSHLAVEISIYVPKLEQVTVGSSEANTEK